MIMYLKKKNEKFLIFLGVLWSNLTGDNLQWDYPCAVRICFPFLCGSRLRIGFNSETTAPHQFVFGNFQSWEMLGKISEILRSG